MAKTRIRARVARAANNDPRGRYAPPAPEDAGYTPRPTNTTAVSSAAASHFAHDDGDDMASWRLSKQDKRAIKHNALLAKVRDAGIQKKKPLKRRRPGRKLATDVGELRDALPHVADSAGMEDDSDMDDEWEGLDDGEEEQGDGDVDMSLGAAAKRRQRRRKLALQQRQGQTQKMVMTSLKHRPGAMRRKMAMEGQEVERFKRNLAQMVGSTAANKSHSQGQDSKGNQTSATATTFATQSDRWAALRNFIGSTMEQNKAFAGA